MTTLPDGARVRHYPTNRYGTLLSRDTVAGTQVVCIAWDTTPRREGYRALSASAEAFLVEAGADDAGEPE